MQAAMMCDCGPSDMRWSLLYLMDHGVSLEFALRVFATPRDDMWWPKRDELRSWSLRKTRRGSNLCSGESRVRCVHEWLPNLLGRDASAK